MRAMTEGRPGSKAVAAVRRSLDRIGDELQEYAAMLQEGQLRPELCTKLRGLAEQAHRVADQARE